MNIDEANEYLGLTALRGSRLGLERVRGLLSLLNDPQESLSVIHIAGTNGKGSVSAMLTSILKASGCKVGSFCSPALTDDKDSFLINGEAISEEKFCELIGYVKPYAESMEDKPTQFEVLAVCAYVYFAQEKCDAAVIECGMGGELDATNVISKPLLSVITNVTLDHTAFLGETVVKIAENKSGIIKKGRPVLFGGKDSSALDVIKYRAEALGAPLYTPDFDKLTVKHTQLGKTLISYKEFEDIELSLSGLYQPDNAAIALEAVNVLIAEGLKISHEAITEGLRSVSWKGRFEVLLDDPLTVFDGAHNADGMKRAAESIREYFGKVIILMGVMSDKAYHEYPNMLSDIAEEILTVRPDNPRSLDPKQLAAVFVQYGIKAETCLSLPSGLEKAIRLAKQKELPLMILGSLYMYKEIYEIISSRSQ